MKFDTIIVGGGIAGLTAAAYLAKAGQKVVVFEKQKKVGGLIQSFERNGVLYDGGLRSIENSGIVFPMLRQLGIEIDFVKSKTSIGIADEVLVLENRESLYDYEQLLGKQFPENKKDIRLIVREIEKAMDYMDVLYGIDNPTFVDLYKDKAYVFKELLPWLFKFTFAMHKINRLSAPVDEYLKKFSENQALIDVIAQHFFQKTPTSFALSYFSLYLDYYYPKGGTAVLVNKIADFVKEYGGLIKTSTTVESHFPDEKYIIDNKGNRVDYDSLIWAADLKQLYNRIPITALKDQKMLVNVEKKKAELKDLKGGDSVFSVYLSIDEHVEYFSKICSGHFFYTPSKKGLSSLDKADIDLFLSTENINKGDEDVKKKVKKYMEEYCILNTFEIAIPALRDPALTPEGKTGMIVSLLFDYQLSKKIDEIGWSNEMKLFLEQTFIRVLDENIFPGIQEKVSGQFSSSPLTIEKLTDSTHGGITGWAFTNPYMPVVHKMMKVAKSVDTIFPSVYQAGQWVYSPSGMPISILTAKLAVDKVLK